MNELRTENANLLPLQQGIPQETPALPLLFPEMPVGQLEQTTPQTETEQWRTVSGFVRYQCSNLGRFRRIRDMEIVSGTVAHNGYIHIGLMRDGIQIVKLAHRLIAETFLIKPSESHEVVNHKNKIRSDNRISNIEWATRSYNAMHAKSTL